MKHRIRTTFQPTVVLEVEGPEYMDLLRQGVLIVEAPAVEEPPVSTPVAAPAAVDTRKNSARRPATEQND